MIENHISKLSVMLGSHISYPAHALAAWAAADQYADPWRWT
jgi:hypothetical protein